MELKTVRNAIVKLLHENIQRPVVRVNQISDKPKKPNTNSVDYPFVTYNFTNTYIKDKEMGYIIDKEVTSTNPRFEKDIMQTIHLQPKFSMSFNAYSLDDIEAKELAMKVWDYFKHKSYYDLLKYNIIVVDCKNVANRDIFEVDSYEKRSGFDVIFRTTHKIDRRLETIESYEVDSKSKEFNDIDSKK